MSLEFSEFREEVDMDGSSHVLEVGRWDQGEATWIRTCSCLFEVLSVDCGQQVGYHRDLDFLPTHPSRLNSQKTGTGKGQRY